MSAYEGLKISARDSKVFWKFEDKIEMNGVTTSR